MVLLVSLATLHIAVKIRESSVIKLSTLAWFGRKRFSEKRITDMELIVLMKLRWRIIAPTAIAYIMHFALLLPDSLDLDTKKKTLESALFLAELSVADSFFIDKRPSVVGFAAMINSLDECDTTKMLPSAKKRYLSNISDAIGMSANNYDEVLAARRRLRLLSMVNG